MKVIDLLNKIANGEEVPKKIKVLDDIYYYCGEELTGNCYYNEPEGCGGRRLSFNTSELNDEIEIIEEDKKIEKCKVNFNTTLPNKATENEAFMMTCINWVADKVNEIIDHINNGDNE